MAEGGGTPVEDQCPVTLDDRALLIPSASSSSPSAVAVLADDAITAASETDALPKTSVSTNRDPVYTITDDSLPSHMRSLLPTHEKHVHDLLTLERTRKRLRYVILVLTLMLALTVVVAVALVLSIKVTPVEGLLEGGGGGSFSMAPFLGGEQGLGMATEVKVSLLGENSSHQQGDFRTRYRHVGGRQWRRTPCVTECWSYAAFRFRAQCQDGFCRCYGDDYDSYTCLPKYNNCNIEKKPPSQSSAKLFHKNQTTYVCHVPSAAREVDDASVHVVSIFGNHRTETTHVRVKNASPSKKTLVLVNYHFVQWTLHLPSHSGVTKIVILSMKRSNQALNMVVVGPATDPEVSHRLSVTGYGEDKNGGHTPKLLRFIEKEIGPVTSFLGASHADEIVLDLKRSATTTTSTTEAMTSKTDTAAATEALSFPIFV